MQRLRLAQFIVLSFCAGIVQSEGAARPFPPPYDPVGQVGSMAALLEERETFALLPVDLFDGERLYDARGNSNMLSDVRFLDRAPTGEEAFEREKLMMDNVLESRGDPTEQSLLVHTAFALPGIDHYVLRLRRPTQLPGQLMIASLWIHSHGYGHRMELLFENAAGTRVPVSVGRLYWHGWRRIQIALPPELRVRGSVEKPYAQTFHGFALYSSPHEKAGDAAVMLDSFLVVSDTQNLSYPGSEIEDNWN